MESKLRKIVLYDAKRNPIVIVSESENVLKGLEVVKKDDECVSDDELSHFKISSNELIKLKYKGKKLDNSIVDCSIHKFIKNIEIREIGILQEECYCKLLRRYVYYHAFLGAVDPNYLSVRNDVHGQLIKMMDKGIYGV